MLRKIGRREIVIARLKKIVNQALNPNFDDFEDALQNYAAEFSTIVTRNKKDSKNSTLNVVTPTEYLKVN